MRESELIAEICKHNAELAACGGAEVLVPPGDDMALVKLNGRRVLVAADQVIAPSGLGTGVQCEHFQNLLRKGNSESYWLSYPHEAVTQYADPTATIILSPIQT